MIRFSPTDIKAINNDFNYAENPWVDDNLLNSAFSSYYYYEDELEQICSIFRGLIKNHAFSDGNKRTASAMLVSYLEQYELDITEENLCALALDVANNNYDIPKIAKKLKSLLTDI